MTIDDVSSASTASAVNVKLIKSQGDEQARVVEKLIDSTAATSPAHTGVGGRVNVFA